MIVSIPGTTPKGEILVVNSWLPAVPARIISHTKIVIMIVTFVHAQPQMVQLVNTVMDTAHARRFVRFQHVQRQNANAILDGVETNAN